MLCNSCDKALLHGATHLLCISIYPTVFVTLSMLVQLLPKVLANV